MMSSLFIGATGLRGYSQGMQVVSNNLANQNTVGFKYNMMLFEDLLSQSICTPSNTMTNMSQRGAGLGITTNRTMFEQGAFEPGSTITDLGINGIGFFGVVKDGVTHYTRAGNFRFDKEGNLLDPSGYGLLGRPIVNGVMGSQAEPIHLDTTSAGIGLCPPKATGSVKINSNLGGLEDMTSLATNPFFALASKWDGTSASPLGAGDAGFSEEISVYDNQGQLRTLTINYDYAGTENGIKVYEYTIGIDPAEDGSAKAGSKAAGLLMAGTLSFASSGNLIGMTAFTPNGPDPADPTQWTQAALKGGIPSFTANFAGSGEQSISFDLGLDISAWDPNLSSPAAGISNPQDFYKTMSGAGPNQNSSTAYGNGIASRNQWQDGYGQGALSDLRINEEGVVTARYSNGQGQDLYQITLYRFISQDGLRHEGDNHFSASPESGPAQEGLPTDENFGSIVAEHIEQSNVDMAREMTQMIITQRAFQMNSKVVTTSDQMLQKALELKRN